MQLIFVDTEEANPTPTGWTLREFGAVDFESRRTFHGKDSSRPTFEAFKTWLECAHARLALREVEIVRDALRVGVDRHDRATGEHGPRFHALRAWCKRGFPNAFADTPGEAEP